MSYQVLARKWRPSVFKDLVGQEAVVRILTNSLKSGRVHPCLIFSGPRGTGKTSTARILAKALNCPKSSNKEPCSQCPVCRDIEQSRSLDVMEIDGASHNGVEAVRQLKDTVGYLPSGPFKIYIIDEVHALSVSAFNALLKTLEEPPPHVVFMMATTEIKKIPATVLSRAQILNFKQIADHLICRHLQKICQAEQVTADETALWMLTREAGGSLRDAQGLLDQMMTFCDKKFQAEEVSSVLGLTDRTLLKSALQNILSRTAENLPDLLNRLHIKGTDPSLFLQNLIRELRNLLLLKLKTSKDISHLIPLSQQEKDDMAKWAKQTSSEEIHFLFDMALKGAGSIARVQDAKVFLEMLLLRMCQAPYIESVFRGPPPLASPKMKHT